MRTFINLFDCRFVSCSIDFARAFVHGFRRQCRRRFAVRDHRNRRDFQDVGDYTADRSDFRIDRCQCVFVIPNEPALVQSVISVNAVPPRIPPASAHGFDIPPARTAPVLVHPEILAGFSLRPTTIPAMPPTYNCLAPDMAADAPLAMLLHASTVPELVQPVISV